MDIHVPREGLQCSQGHTARQCCIQDEDLVPRLSIGGSSPQHSFFYVLIPLT